ncbi:MAG: ROK family protein [Deltaproteobacteria bacterium]|nr:ROK family protein [Deltaproteobacteria bacterium]
MIGIDVGGTRIKAGRVDEHGRVLAEAVVEVGDARSPDDIVKNLVDLIDQLEPGGKAPVGVAAAGVLDARQGLVRESPNFPSWRDFPLGARVAAETGRKVVLENDANAVVWGEAVAGAGRGFGTLVGYTLGTGIGGGIVLDHHLWRGVRGMAGELGHVTVVPDGRPCGCGNHGCLEQYAGSVGLVKTLAASTGPLAALAADPGHAAHHLAERAHAGDPEARAIFAQAGRYLGQAAAALVHTLDLTLIVLCGGVGEGAFDLIAPAMDQELVARTFRSMGAGVTIRKGELGPAAGIIGAALLAAR